MKSRLLRYLLLPALLATAGGMMFVRGTTSPKFWFVVGSDRWMYTWMIDSNSRVIDTTYGIPQEIEINQNTQMYEMVFKHSDNNFYLMPIWRRPLRVFGRQILLYSTFTFEFRRLNLQDNSPQAVIREKYDRQLIVQQSGLPISEQGDRGSYNAPAICGLASLAIASAIALYGATKATIATLRRREAKRRVSKAVCIHCGYPTDVEFERCPECGREKLEELT